MTSRLVSFAAPICMGCLAAIMALSAIGSSEGRTYRDREHSPIAASNPVLAKLYDAMVLDHRPSISQVVLAPAKLVENDADRIDRVRTMYLESSIQSGQDCYDAASILRRSKHSEDLILAHDLAIIALSYDQPMAKALAAETEDRYLLSIGRPQRFGTQSKTNQRNRQFDGSINPLVTQDLRVQMDVSTLKD